MTEHLTQLEILGYLCNTLTDSDRENYDAHLSACPICRENLKLHERNYRQVQFELRTEFADIQPSRDMDYRAIATQVSKGARKYKIWPGLSVAAPVMLAFAGFLLAVISVLKAADLSTLQRVAESYGAYPTLACFFLTLASVEQFDRSRILQPRLILMAVIAVVIWLGSAFIGLLNILAIQELAIMASVSAGWHISEVTPVAMIAAVLGGILYIGVVIGGFEYHYRNLGQPSSWKFFSITLLGQLFLLILPYLLA